MDDIVIAQLTDLHIGPASDPICAQNADRLDICLNRISQMRRQPDLILLTGDLTEHGDDESFRYVLNRVKQIKIPVRVALGNHDVKLKSAASIRHEYFLSQDWTSDEDSQNSLRVILADTCETGVHGGVFSEERAFDLAMILSAKTDTPTLLAIHHPPCPIGIDWMDPLMAEPWANRLKEVIQGAPQIIGIICGHVHVSAHTEFAGVRLGVAPAVAPQSHVELATIDANTPDGRPLIVNSQPAFALHHFVDGAWTSLTVYADDAAPLVCYEGEHAGIVKLTQERDT